MLFRVKLTLGFYVVFACHTAMSAVASGEGRELVSGSLDYLSSQIDQEDKDFVESFIKHYECNPEGRYTHEYHPYLLKHTSESLEGLVKELRGNGLNIAGRMVILGYEENAVPCYYTDFTRPQIDDEMILKTKVGWSQKLHNRFGFMTAFLFKDFNKLSEMIYPGVDPVFEHIDVESIPIFDDRAEIFQEDAFDESLDLIVQAYKSVLKKYVKKDIDGILNDLVKFWEFLYTYAPRIGNKQIAGTQDILFSMEYVKGLIGSNVPILKFFTGPDLTYPIEISCKQKKGVTRHAQKFVQKMVKKLVPVNNQKTVYIFCSFVDGVGKSTMLGNIKNWMKHGDNVDNFGHVDNTSSQLAELFEFNKDVFIADLPAQISHFTYKPDGFVYTGVENEFNYQQVKSIRDYVQQNKADLLAQYDVLVDDVYKIIEVSGFLDPALSDIDRPENWFIKNVILLKRIKSNKFVPFSFQGQHFIFDLTQPREIRLLKKLENVKSEGLKNIEAEQMLFNLGVRLPLKYEVFLADLVKKIKDNGVTNVVFVDFLSMYPRSSRENLRVNYLLQQLALLYSGFDPAYSFYRDFVSGGELLSCLMNRESCFKIYEAMRAESVLRLVLFKLILQHKVNDLTGLSLAEITSLLSGELEKNKHILDSKFLYELIKKKLDVESDTLEKVYGFSKSFVNIQQLSFDRLLAFFNILQNLFDNIVKGSRMNDLWQYVGTLRDEGIEPNSTSCDFGLMTDLGFEIKPHFMFESECRCEVTLSPFLRMLRANWYAAISNLLFASRGFGNNLELTDEFLNVIPCFLSRGQNGCTYLFQRIFPFWESQIPNPDLNKFKILNLLDTVQPTEQPSSFVVVDDLPYRFDWAAGSTNIGVFQFDCDLDELKHNKYWGSTISLLVRKYQASHDTATVMPTSVLWEEMSKSSVWKSEYSGKVYATTQNGSYDIKINFTQELDEKPDFKSRRIFRNYNEHGRVNKVYAGLEEQRFAARLFVRLIATLEMVLKDPDSDIVVRYGNRDDFQAALRLLESVTLPIYFGILFKEPLFNDYDAVEPYPSWDYWDGL